MKTINKGLAIHIIVTLIYILMYWWVTEPLNNTNGDLAIQRLVAVIILLIIHLILFFDCIENNYYNQKIK